MPRRQTIRMKDLVTNEMYEFSTLREASDHIKKVTGQQILPSTVDRAMKRNGRVAKKRFQLFHIPVEKDYGFNRTIKEDGWEYTQYAVSKRVMVAEKKVKWYDEERIKRITNYLKSRGCMVFWDMIGDYAGAVRNNTRVEIYKKFPDNTEFNDKVAALKEIISGAKNYLFETE